MCQRCDEVYEREHGPESHGVLAQLQEIVDGPEWVPVRERRALDDARGRASREG